LSLKVRKEHILRILRRIFGSRIEKLTGGWSKLHKKEQKAEHAARMREIRNACRISV
jgi:hypothetical protein